jgi:putative Mg2+ transporter-C (MgtC) family protein
VTAGYNPKNMRWFLEILRTAEGSFLSQTMLRLVLAAVLGGAIGLQRELWHKAAGLRTHLFICFGSALFTILSFQLANVYPGDHTRIAAQIIPGIGFIGAGSILHARGSVTGLTTAATIFVVASIGMAAGGGLYLPAIFSTVLILICLSLLGVLEVRLGLRSRVMAYDAVGPNGEAIISAANRILEDEGREMQSVHVDRSDHPYSVRFTVDATRREHDALMERLHQDPAFTSIKSRQVEGK